MTIQLKQPEFVKQQGSARTVFGRARQQDALTHNDDARQNRGRLFKICPECGSKNPGNAEFCEVDGVDLGNPVSTTSSPKDSVLVEDTLHENLEEVDPEIKAVDTGTDEGDSQLAAEVAPKVSIEIAEKPNKLSPERKKGSIARIGFIAMVMSLVGVSVWYFSNDSVSVTPPSAQAPMVIDRGQESVSSALNETKTIPRIDQAALMQAVETEKINTEMLALSLGNLESSLAEETPPLPLTDDQTQALQVNTGDPDAEKSIDAADQKALKELQQQLIIILKDGGFDGFDVIADVDGVVTLKGVVSDILTKQSVLVLVSQYDGVTRVRDKIFLID